MPTLSYRIAQFLTLAYALHFSTANAVPIDAWKPLHLNVTDIESQRGGLLHVFVFGPEGFPTKHDKALKSYSLDVQETQTSITIEVPATAPFALKIHHDEDGNHKVTKNWIGIIPVEGFGFSAGARVSFGPPSFRDAQMHWPVSAKTAVPMIYP